MFSPILRGGLTVAAALLLAASISLQYKIDPERHQFEPLTSNVNKAAEQLPIEFALGAATGLREAVAGMLWVRTDEYFDEGNYDAIPPMIRIITWLDPHNTDVYETGAWHMDYNFTDEQNRSDRRYIPFSVALLEEGIANNPNDSGLYSDLAQTHLVRKMGDEESAITWFQKGQQLASTEPDTWDVTSVGHGLAHALTAAGRTDEAIAEWKYVVAQHQARVAKDPKDYIDTLMLRVAQKNLQETVLRKKWRAIMTKPPVDAQFDATISRVSPMYFVVTGTMQLPQSQKFVLETGEHQWAPADGDRVEIRLQDYDYHVPATKAFTLNYDVGKGTTIMQDSASVHNGTFRKSINMSTDSTGSQPMYPFKADKYLLTVWTNPTSELDIPIPVGDRVGYLGEGMTDKKYVDMSGHVPGTFEDSRVLGLHMLVKTFVLSRADLLGNTPQTFH